MKQTGSISILHVIFLSMTVIGLKNHVTIIPSLLEDAGRDGWISILLAAVMVFPLIFLFIYIHRVTNRQHIGDWLASAIGTVPAVSVRYITAFYLLIMAAFTLAEALHWITATFLPNTPLVPMLLIYCILCILLVTTDLQTIVMVNALVLSFVVVLGFFVAITNIQVKNYEMLRPFLEHGFQPVLLSAAYPASGFLELMLLLFLQHQVKDRIRWYHFAIMLFILVGLTTGPLIGAITEFGPEEARQQRYPAYEEWGLVAIGRFFNHVDFLSIYQWLTGAFIRIGLLLYIAVDLLKWTGDKKRIWNVIGPAFFFMSLSLFLLSEYTFLKLKGEYLLISTLTFLLLLTILLTIAAFLSRKASKTSN
ncbi:endospore germination permease [Sporosarcina sp.]|uniref:endospore germination permease n=1 Tax=Sporosarcina sp. TaxID=49982 RepID=UPI0026346874|nr:endospore germination permease [Sporosarcina sp.]